MRASIVEVAKAFIRPKSYTLDIDRLLLGRDAALRTHYVGLLHIFIHGAQDLPKTDAMGMPFMDWNSHASLKIV